MAGYRSLKRVTRAPHGGGLLAFLVFAHGPTATAGTSGTLAPTACETPQNTHATLAAI